ncbi:MAG: GTP cyclohydrolase FolE2 [Verrucomicrobiales bacterium]
MSSLPDTQSQQDDRQLAIDRVGVRGLRYPVQIREKGGRLQHTVATVSLAVDLPHHHKGTHMSRFLEVLNIHGPILDVQSIAALPGELRRRLNAKKAHVEFRFPFFLEKTAPVTGSRGLLDYQVAFEVNTAAEIDFVVHVEAAVTTLCPCSKAISARGAHNQRGVVRLSVRFRKPIWIEDLIRLIEGSASSELYSVLKRPDEKAVTERAYDNPVFVEDVVRNVATRLGEMSEVIWYHVEAENMESIHNHQAFASIEKGHPPAANRKISNQLSE